MIQTDDQTLDGLYATARAYPGAPETRAMPATLDLIAKKGITFNRYYVSYPLCCPSRVSLLTGRYAHNHKVKGNVQPNGGYIGFSFRGAMTHNLATWLQADGYKTVHIGKFLNGYGEKPLDPGTTVPPGWSTWYTILNVDSTHLSYGYEMDVNGQVVGPFGDPGDWETREYGVRDDIGCPFAPTNGLPCYHVTDALTNIATSEIAATPGDQPLYLQLDYTAPHGDFRRPAGPEPTPRHYDWFQGASLPHDSEEGLDEGDVSDKPQVHPRSRPPHPERAPHLPGLLPEAARVPARRRRRRPAGGQHAGRRRAASRTPTSSSPPTTGSSSASTGCSAASSSPTSRRPTCRC